MIWYFNWHASNQQEQPNSASQPIHKPKPNLTFSHTNSQYPYQPLTQIKIQINGFDESKNWALHSVKWLNTEDWFQWQYRPCGTNTITQNWINGYKFIIQKYQDPI